MLSDAYKNTIRTRAIQQFVKDNKRSPTEAEERKLINEAFEKYSNADQVGISSLDVTLPKFMEPASSSQENSNVESLYADYSTIINRIDAAGDLLEDSFRSVQATSIKTSKLLSKIEQRCENLLLLSRKTDAFVYGVEESFSTQENIDFANTTATVEAGYATCRRGGYTKISPSKYKIRSTAGSAKGISSSVVTGNVESLKETDGSYWEHVAYTKYARGRVSLLLDIEFDEAQFVSSVKFSTNPVSANSRMTASFFYSIDGQTFTALEGQSEIVVSSNELDVAIGIEGVKAIQCLFSKGAADSVTLVEKENVYIFGFDSLEVYADSFKENSDSILYAGPYFIYNEMNKPVKFTKAKLSACVEEPNDTSISFFISNDGTNYQPCNHRDESNDVVNFGSGYFEQSAGRVDASLGGESLLESVSSLNEIDFFDEAVVNRYILPAFVDLVPVQGITFKRDIRPTADSTEVLGSPRGWSFNAETGDYQCTVYVSSRGGKDIDFGPGGVKVNGSTLSGVVNLKQGYSVISTSDSNWSTIPERLTNSDQVIAADPLYPYNHRYLIEPYNYALGFQGEKVYTGVDEFFGRLLKYISPEEFQSEQRKGDYDVFTIETVDDNSYFKIKVDKTNATWRDELCSVEWLVQSSSDNKIWVKAVMLTADTKVTPKIDHFKIRVI